MDGLGHCWSCLEDLTEDSVVWIDDDHSSQCCRDCWKKISVPQRLEIALKFHDRTIHGLGVRETMDAIRDLISSSINGYFNRVLDDEKRMN